MTWDSSATRTSSTGNRCDLGLSGEQCREDLLERVMFELRPEDKQEFVRYKKKRKGKWAKEESRCAIFQWVGKDYFNCKG